MKKNYFLKAFLISLICFGINLNAQITWDGSTNSVWSEASNWDTNTVPDDTATSVIIPDVTNDPIINGASITLFGSLTLEANATLTITNSGYLKQSDIGIGLSSTITNNGSIIINSGS